MPGRVVRRNLQGPTIVLPGSLPVPFVEGLGGRETNVGFRHFRLEFQGSQRRRAGTWQSKVRRQNAEGPERDVAVCQASIRRSKRRVGLECFPERCYGLVQSLDRPLVPKEPADRVLSGTFSYRIRPWILPRLQAVHGMQVMRNPSWKIIVNEFPLRVRPPVLLAPDKAILRAVNEFDLCGDLGFATLNGTGQ